MGNRFKYTSDGNGSTNSSANSNSTNHLADSNSASQNHFNINNLKNKFQQMEHQAKTKLKDNQNNKNEASQVNDTYQQDDKLNHENTLQNEDNLSNDSLKRQPKPIHKNILPQLLITAGIIFGGYYGYQHFIKGNLNHNSTTQTINNANQTTSSSQFNNVNLYKYPSEKGKNYPDIHQVTSVSVDLAKQRLYIMNNQTVLYTMLITSGMNGTTPKGNFMIQNAQGTKSYDKQFQRGMNYWQSFSGEGKYVFSTIWTNADGTYRVPKVNSLGVKPSTNNGNIQLSVPDAKFIYDLILGTPVKIY